MASPTTHTCHRRGAILVLGDVMSHLEKGELIMCPNRDGSPLTASITSGKLLLVSPAQSFFVSGPIDTHGHIYVLTRLLHVLKWGLLFDERRGLTTTGHSPAIGE
jgi:hypothetical protein